MQFTPAGPSAKCGRIVLSPAVCCGDEDSAIQRLLNCAARNGRERDLGWKQRGQTYMKEKNRLVNDGHVRTTTHEHLSESDGD